MTSQDVRCFFRLAYPDSERPWIVIEGRRLELTEVSEFGLRYICEDTGNCEVGKQVAGDIWFADGERIRVSGEVYRLSEDGEVVLKLDKGVSQRRINMEQLRLMRAFAGRN